MEHRALGKGLAALIPEKVELSSSGSVAYVQTSLLKENSLQPRMNYDEAKLNELIASIKEKGVLQPILVRERDGGYEVIAGERRLKAAQALNLEKIPVIIKTVTDQEALVLALVENIQREELNPIEEAKAFKRLIDDFNFTQDTVAQSVGKDRSTVANILRLLKLPEEIQKSLSIGQLSMGHARALLSVEDAFEQKQIFDYVIKKELSVRELENLVKRGLKSILRFKKLSPVKRNPDLVTLEEELQRALGTKVRIQAQKKRGKVIIEYYSIEDLKRVIQLMLPK